MFNFGSSEYSVTEDGVKVTVTVIRSVASAGMATVDYQTTIDGSTATAMEDFNTLPASTLVFAAGVVEKTFDLYIKDDTIYDPDEVVSVTISNAQSAGNLECPVPSIGLQDEASVVIRDTEDISVSFTAAEQQAVEGTSFYVQVVREAMSEQTIPELMVRSLV